MKTTVQSSQLRFSLVVPVYDEQDNVDPLLDEIAEVLTPLGPFEAILVDDGSTDDTARRMVHWKDSHRADWLRILRTAPESPAAAAARANLERLDVRIE